MGSNAGDGLARAQGEKILVIPQQDLYESAKKQREITPRKEHAKFENCWLVSYHALLSTLRGGSPRCFSVDFIECQLGIRLVLQGIKTTSQKLKCECASNRSVEHACKRIYKNKCVLTCGLRNLTRMHGDTILTHVRIAAKNTCQYRRQRSTTVNICTRVVENPANSL